VVEKAVDEALADVVEVDEPVDTLVAVDVLVDVLDVRVTRVVVVVVAVPRTLNKSSRHLLTITHLQDTGCTTHFGTGKPTHPHKL
jgi:hypothetical protein